MMQDHHIKIFILKNINFFEKKKEAKVDEQYYYEASLEFKEVKFNITNHRELKTDTSIIKGFSLNLRPQMKIISLETICAMGTCNFYIKATTCTNQ